MTHATFTILFCFLSFSFFCERFQSLPWTQSASCILLIILLNPIKLDLLDSRFFVFRENRVAFDIKIKKKKWTSLLKLWTFSWGGDFLYCKSSIKGLSSLLKNAVLFLTCLKIFLFLSINMLTLILRMPHICVFLVYLSFSHF